MPAQFTKHFVQDLQQDIKIRQCGTLVFNADNESNVISVDLYNGTEEYSCGGTVVGACICPDGSTVALTGSISGKTASVVLTGDCFAIPGQIGIGVQVVSGTVKTTVLKAIYNVELFETDDMVDPGSRITASVGQLVADIEAATAEIPASDMASLMSGIAPTFSTSTNYAAGAYVYYNGTLYKFTSAHAAGSWTGTDATAVALGNDVTTLNNDVSDLRSAVGSYNVENDPFVNSEVLYCLPYHEYEAINTSSWQGNPSRFEFEASPGEVFTLAIADYHGCGTQKALIRFLDANDATLSTYYLNPQTGGNDIYSWIAPPNTAKAYSIAYVIGSGETPVVGQKYWFRNWYVVKGYLQLNEYVKVTNKNLQDESIYYNNLQGLNKKYTIGVRSGTKYPNLDSTAKTITFYSGTVLLDYTGTEIYRTTADTTIALNASEQICYIAYDKTNAAFVSIRGGINFTSSASRDLYIPLGAICVSSGSSFGLGWIGIPHTVDGYVKIGDISGANLQDEVIQYRMLGNGIKHYTFAIGPYADYPNYNTTTYTLTLPARFRIYDMTGTAIFETQEATDIVLPTVSQNLRIVYQRSTSTFSAINSSTNISGTDYIELGLIARRTGFGWIGIPHTINGENPYIHHYDPVNELPDNWAAKLTDITTAKDGKFSFIIQTDTHYEFNKNDSYGNNLRILTNKTEWDFAANLGDILEGYASDTNPEMRAAIMQLMHRYTDGIACPFFVAMGNHDTNAQSPSGATKVPFTFDEVWGYEFKPALDTAPGAIMPSGIAKPMYYYMDFYQTTASTGIRVIVLNTQDGTNGGFGIGSAQAEWFQSVLNSTTLPVMVLSHVPLVPGIADRDNYNYSTTFVPVVEALEAYHQSHPVIGCFAGHMHIQADKLVNGINYIVFQNGAGIAESVFVDLSAKTINTISIGFTGNRSWSFT